MRRVDRWLGRVGWGLLMLFALAALFAPSLSPHDPAKVYGPMLPPPPHLLGTNDIGQDVLSKLLYGARFSLLVGALTAGLSTVTGIGLGVIVGYYNRTGFAIMRLVENFCEWRNGYVL